MDLKLIRTKDIKELKKALQNIRDDNAAIQDVWLTTEETSKFLNVSTKTLKRYRDKSKLAYSKDGRKIRYKKSDILKYLECFYIEVNDSKNKDNF